MKKLVFSITMMSIFLLACNKDDEVIASESQSSKKKANVEKHETRNNNVDYPENKVAAPPPGHPDNPCGGGLASCTVSECETILCQTYLFGSIGVCDCLDHNEEPASFPISPGPGVDLNQFNSDINDFLTGEIDSPASNELAQEIDALIESIWDEDLEAYKQSSEAIMDIMENQLTDGELDQIETWLLNWLG